VGIQLYPDNKVPTWQLPISTLIHIYNIQWCQIDTFTPEQTKQFKKKTERARSSVQYGDSFTTLYQHGFQINRSWGLNKLRSFHTIPMTGASIYGSTQQND
jgi:hypothetical protein